MALPILAKAIGGSLVKGAAKKAIGGDKKKINWIRLGQDKFGQTKVKKIGHAFTKGEKNYGFVC